MRAVKYKTCDNFLCKSHLFYKGEEIYVVEDRIRDYIRVFNSNRDEVGTLEDYEFEEYKEFLSPPNKG